MIRLKTATACLITIAAAFAASPRAEAGFLSQVYWPFDEFGGPTAFDASGNGYNGTYYGDITYRVPAPSGYGVSIHGVNDPGYMAATVPMTASFSVIAWARSATPTWNKDGWIMSDRSPNGFIIHPNAGTNSVGFYIGSNGYNTYIPINTFVAVDDITAWHQYAITYEAYPNPDPNDTNPADAFTTGWGNAYIDGVQVASTYFPALNRFSLFGAGQIYVGRDDPFNGYPDRYGDGSVDPGVANTALSPTDILANFDSPASVPEPAGLLLMSSGALALMVQSWLRFTRLGARFGRHPLEADKMH